jgi:hypothetical protein
MLLYFYTCFMLGSHILADLACAFASPIKTRRRQLSPYKTHLIIGFWWKSRRGWYRICEAQLILEFEPHPTLFGRNPNKWTWLNGLDPLGNSTLKRYMGK